MSDIESLSKRAEYALKLYNSMVNDCNYDPVSGKQVWTGTVTKLVNSLGIPVSHYSLLMRFLKKSECLVQVRKGGNGTSSVYVLDHCPTREDWDRYNGIERASRFSNAVGNSDEVLAMSARLRELEINYKNIAYSIEGLSARLDSLALRSAQ